TSMQEHEQLATLEELFEFIDCCVCPDLFPDSIHEADPCCERVMLPSEHVTIKTSPQSSPTTVDRTECEKLSKPKRRRKRTGWSSSTGLQRRKRAELQFLREHVRDLEAYANKLKKRGQGEKAENGSSCNWQEVAVTAYMERQKAEETNRALKEIMDNQLQVSAALQLIAEQKSLV
ncbi:hypothetical protein PHMEG_00028609, partial [Phytophthora megakarya]